MFLFGRSAWPRSCAVLIPSPGRPRITQHAPASLFLTESNLMQKLNSTSTAPGATLLRKLHEATEAPAAQRTSLFGPMFVRKAAQPVPTAGKKPTPLTVAPSAMRCSPGEVPAHGDDFRDDDPAHVHNRHLRETAAAHAALLASFKTIYSGPPTNPSKGPVGL